MIRRPFLLGGFASCRKDVAFERGPALRLRVRIRLLDLEGLSRSNGRYAARRAREDLDTVVVCGARRQARIDNAPAGCLDF